MGMQEKLLCNGLISRALVYFIYRCLAEETQDAFRSLSELTGMLNWNNFADNSETEVGFVGSKALAVSDRFIRTCVASLFGEAFDMQHISLDDPVSVYRFHYRKRSDETRG